MKEAVFEFQFVTPALLAGADQQTAEMRIPSIRGVLRWWARTLYSVEWENNCFGSVRGGSPTSSAVILRLERANQRVLKSQNALSIGGDKYDYFLWPLQTNPRGVLDVGSRFKVSCRVKPGREEDADGIDNIIKAFLLFGSLGTRSRRAYGSIWPQKAVFDGEEWQIPRTTEELVSEADQWFSENGSLIQLSDPVRDWKAAVKVCADCLKRLRCGKDQYASRWGKSDHDAGIGRGEVIYRAALGLPLIQRYSKNGPVVTYSVRGMDRLASPLHFKVIKLQDGFLPILLIIAKDVPDKGTIVIGKNNRGGSVALKLDHDLLNNIYNCNKDFCDFCPGARQLSKWETD
ncbi:MAG: hypothetical protein MJ016_01180 [Victivallaceae bacterium]|nr:hypothetical protein [Victivallaceae bacterium]